MVPAVRGSPTGSRRGKHTLRAVSRWRWLLPLAGATLACSGGFGAGPPSAGGSRAQTALEEAQQFCHARLAGDPHERAALERRLELEQRRLASGAWALGNPTGNLAQIQHEASAECLAQVAPALSGEGGKEATGILQAARLECESDDLPSAAALLQCIQRRTLEIFTRRGHGDDASQRDTLDRLLRVVGGEALSPEQREAYCRARELGGTGHPLCD